MFTLIFPFYNQDAIRLPQSLELVGNSLETYHINQVLLCHNGQSMPASLLKLLALEKFTFIELLHTDKPGIGAGYKLGIRHATQPFVVLSASDLPFGFSDIQSFLALPDCNTNRLTIGSKAHKRSIITGRSQLRSIMSTVYYWMRVAILGNGTPHDSQGTLIIQRELALELVPFSICDNYSFSLEMASYSIEKGIPALEVPVIYSHSTRSSSISLATDIMRMMKDLFLIRRRISQVRSLVL